MILRFLQTGVINSRYWSIHKDCFLFFIKFYLQDLLSKLGTWGPWEKIEEEEGGREGSMAFLNESMLKEINSKAPSLTIFHHLCYSTDNGSWLEQSVHDQYTAHSPRVLSVFIKERNMKTYNGPSLWNRWSPKWIWALPMLQTHWKPIPSPVYGDGDSVCGKC